MIKEKGEKERGRNYMNRVFVICQVLGQVFEIYNFYNYLESRDQFFYFKMMELGLGRLCNLFLVIL